MFNVHPERVSACLGTAQHYVGGNPSASGVGTVSGAFYFCCFAHVKNAKKYPCLCFCPPSPTQFDSNDSNRNWPCREKSRFSVIHNILLAIRIGIFFYVF